MLKLYSFTSVECQLFPTSMTTTGVTGVLTVAGRYREREREGESAKSINIESLGIHPEPLDIPLMT